jgi:arylsulfatase
MNKNFKYTLNVSLLMLAYGSHAAQQRPNIVTIVLDDSGFSDIGAFGSEIATPNLDALAADGVKFANFYAAATSSPSRAMYFTGRDAHAVGIGNMAEFLRPEQKGKPGYETYLNKRFPTFPERLQQSGYQNFYLGKWHMGGQPGYRPSERGFSRYYAIHGGAANFYQKPDGTPNVVWHEGLYQEMGIPATDYYEDGRPVMKFPQDFYATDYFGDKALSYLGQRDKAKPFYLHMAFNAPHWPLQAPEEVTQKYLKIYQTGWDNIRAQRFERLKQRGFVSDKAQMPTLWPDVPLWKSLDATEQARETRKMAVYAAMIEVADQNVGKIVRYLKENNLYDNTLFMVMSDNGASYKDPSTDANFVIFSREWIKDINRRFNNASDNIGHWNSLVGYTQGWAAASSTPLNRYKETLFDGGVHVWAFTTWPGKTQNRIAQSVYSVMDIAPTLLEITHTPQPTQQPPMTGQSFSSLYLGKKSIPVARTLGWELNGMRGLRDGRYKLSTTQYDPQTYLYDLATDPYEQQDIGEQRPALKAKLLKKYQQYAIQNGVIPVSVQPKP